jgi:hypothetical protein
LSGDADLAHEPLTPERRGKFGPEDLECDPAVVTLIEGEVDECHAAPAELSLDNVATDESRPKTPHEIGHRAIMEASATVGQSVTRA